MIIGVIAVSSRQGAYSLKVAENLAGQLEQNNTQAFVVSLYQLALPLFGQPIEPSTAQELEGARKKLRAAAGFVVVTPEWNGTAPPAWNNLMLYVGDDLAHKPVMSVGVSAGRGGAYPLLAIRSSGYKNSRYVVIPETLIVSHCEEALASDGSLTDNPAAEPLKIGVKPALEALLAYAKALAVVRSNLNVNK